MRRLSFFVAVLTVVPAARGGETGLPLHPDDLKIVRRMAAHEGLDAPPVVLNGTGFPAPRGAKYVRFASTERPRHVLNVLYDAGGRVTELRGNGPLLDNEALGWAAGLPELRVLRIDHNVPHPGSRTPHARYDGSGFAALRCSKLAEVKIGHAFDDRGLAALAQIPSLRVLEVLHGKVTDAGTAHLARHPNLESVTFSPMGRPDVTDKTLATLATVPKLRRVGMHETFVTYEHGLKHLAPLRGRLQAVSLKWSLVLPADLEKLRADHPGAEITTSTPAEVADKPFRRNQLLRWASPAAADLLRQAEASP